jgi:jouberin
LAIWGEKFIFNESIDILYQSDHIVLFEVIDQTIHPKRSCFNPIAWAFLMPKKPLKKRYVLQLFSYPAKFDASLLGSSLPVLSLFSGRTSVPSTNAIEIAAIDPRETSDLFSRPRNVFERELANADVRKLLSASEEEEKAEKEEGSEKGDDDFPDVPPPEPRIRRTCEIPKCLAAQIPAGENGVLVVRFNNHGTILAAGLQIDGSFSIQFYDTRTLLLMTTVKAHLDLIYELAFSHQDALLLSVSADGMAKVWDMATFQFKRSLAHSNYLYSGKFHPKNDAFVATAGIDGVARIWNRHTGELLAAIPKHSTRINSIVFSPNGKKLYSGDANGCIAVWLFEYQRDELKTFAAEKLVRHREIDGICITNMSMGKSDYALLVVTQDSFIRNFETDAMEVLQRFPGAKCTRYRMEAAFSPDGSYVFAGSETGSVVLWAVRGREPIPVNQWNQKFDKPVTSVTWNPETDQIAFTSFGPRQNILVFDVGTNPDVRVRARRLRSRGPLPTPDS